MPGRIGRRCGMLAAVIAAAAVLAGAAPSAPAATFVVTDRGDPAPGACDADCSLREAVIAANAREGADTISLPANGVHQLSLPSSGEDAALDGDLDVTSGPLTIEHPGEGRAKIDGGSRDRIFDVASAEVRISDLLISFGSASEADGDGDGGAIKVGSGGALTVLRTRIYGNEAAGSGGGIDLDGDAALRFVKGELAGNTAALEGGGISGAAGPVTIERSLLVKGQAKRGGAVALQGPALIEASQFNGNGEINPVPPTTVSGGAVYAGRGAALTVVNSSITGGVATRAGGAIYVDTGATAAVNAATIVGNRARAGGGLYAADSPDAVLVANSIVSRNRAVDGGDCAASTPDGVTSGGSNLLSTLAGGCGFARPRDLVSGSPRLRATRRGLVPRSDSPAVDAAGQDAPKVDLNGRRRGPKPDIGAIER